MTAATDWVDSSCWLDLHDHVLLSSTGLELHSRRRPHAGGRGGYLCQMRTKTDKGGMDDVTKLHIPCGRTLLMAPKTGYIRVT